MIINKESMKETFLRYVAVNTKSDPSSETTPSTEIQFDLAKILLQELIDLGLDAEMDEHGYVYGRLKANTDTKCKTVCFLAHMDTAPDLSGENVSPQIIDNYDGNIIKLNEEYNLDPEVFPSLKDFVGKTLITTSGDTLLGADDKAGIAEIMLAIKTLVHDDSIKHGDVVVCFTPDEEIGRGVDKINLDKVCADFAYTIDGGEPGVFSYENFNAAGATITIQGLNVHPGEAIGKMVNASTIARNIDLDLGDEQRPENTDMYDGFFLLTSLNSTVDHATMNYIIRDHNREIFEERKEKLADIVNKYQSLNPKAHIDLEISDNYYNMLEMVTPHPYIVEYAKTAYKNNGYDLKELPIRGGTDGSRLSFMGLPCPNIFTGGYNFHGRFEYVCLDSMLDASNVIVDIIKEVHINA